MNTKKTVKKAAKKSVKKVSFFDLSEKQKDAFFVEQRKAMEKVCNKYGQSLNAMLVVAITNDGDIVTGGGFYEGEVLQMKLTKKHAIELALKKLNDDLGLSADPDSFLNLFS